MSEGGVKGGVGGVCGNGVEEKDSRAGGSQPVNQSPAQAGPPADPL